MTDPDRWAPLRGLLAAVSPGPWEYRSSTDGETDYPATPALVSAHTATPGVLGTFHRAADGEFAAMARQAVPDLLAELDRLSRYRETLEDIAAMDAEDFADRGDAAIAIQHIAERALRR